MRGKRLLSLLLTMAMLFSVISAALAVGPEDGVSSTYTEEPYSGDADNELRFEGGEWTMTKKDEVPLGDDSLHGPEDMVKVIVVMEDQPLIKYAVASGMDVGDYMTTSAALSLEAAILDSHTAAVSAIRAAVPEASDIGYDYTAVLNGFSMELPYGRISEVESIPGVKRVSLVEYYSLPKDQGSFDLQMADSTGIIGSDKVNQNNSYNGADGSGAVVAILDTGLDTDHEAFTVMPESFSYTEDKVQDLIDSCRMGLSSGVTDAEDSWVNEKIPYAYDYAGRDTDVNGGAEHGTHVAGTVAGNNGEDFSGVAPNAQLMIMKIFSDGASSTSNDIITAGLDDAVKLGADAINMSLGSAAGFTYDRTTEDEVYNNCWDAGINLMVAAGNDTSSSYMNRFNDLPLADSVDNAIVGNPSTGYDAMSVASVDNTKEQSYYFVGKDAEIVDPDPDAPAGAAEDPEESEGTIFGFLPMVYAGSNTYTDVWPYLYANYGDTTATWELEVIEGFGAESDYTEDQKDLTGKIALISRGGADELTFEEKTRIAVQVHKAKAVIIYNNVDGKIAPAYNSYYGAMVGITKADGEALIKAVEEAKAADKKYTVTFGPLQATDYPYNTPEEDKIPWVTMLPSETAGQVSSFSSIGPAPDLTLKPEISAPGGNIISSIPGGGYALMSGTSMATPHMAGAAALVRNYVKNTLGKTDRKTIRDITEDLLMSTAVPAKNENNAEFSPRWQGAGVVNVLKATTSGAYLTVDHTDESRPKAELGSSTNGVYSFSFDIHSISDEAVTYTLISSGLVEDVIEVSGLKFAGGVARNLDEDEFSVTYSGYQVNNGVVTVPAHTTVTVDATITLSDTYKSWLEKNYKNGNYVEGYIYLQPTNGDESSVQLTLPYLGFYGDWEHAGTVFESDPDSDWLLQPTLFASVNESGVGYYLGENAYDEGQEDPTDTYNYERLAFSPSIAGVPQHFGILLSTRRNLTDFSMTIEDEDGKPYWGLISDYLPKTYAYFNGVGYAYTTTQVVLEGWNGRLFDEETQSYTGEPAETGKLYNLVFSGNVGQSDSGYTEVTYPFWLDGSDPVVDNVSTYLDDNGVFTLAFDVQDDHFIRIVNIADSTNQWLLTYTAEGFSSIEKQGTKTHVTMDLDGLSDFLAQNGLNPGRIKIIAQDCALNEGYVYVDLGPQFMSLANMTVAVGDSQKASLRILPERLQDTLRLTWKSADEAIATVSDTGLVTGVSKGEATISVSTENGLTASCHVTIGDTTLPPQQPDTPDEDAPVDKPRAEAFPTVIETPASGTGNCKDLGKVFEDGNTNLWYKITSANTAQVVSSPDAPAYGNINPNLPAEIEIPETVTYEGNDYTVTSIGYKAFYDCTQLTSVKLPDTLRVIGDQAFWMCSALKDMTLPEGLEEVGYWGLYFVPADLNLPKSLRYVGQEAFSFSGITEISFGDAIEYIAPRAFDFCQSLTKAELPLAAQDAEGIYMHCAVLADVTIADGLTYIPENCFYMDSALTDIDIPEGVTELGDAAFYGTGLSEIKLPSTVTILGDYAFAGLDNCRDFVIPDSVTYVGSYIFYWSKYVKTITVGANVAYIGNGFSTYFIDNSVDAVVPEVRSATAAAALRRSGFMGAMTHDGLPYDVYAGSPFIVDGIDYMPISETDVMVTGYEQGDVSSIITIPETVICEGDEKTYTVTAVADSVFSQKYGFTEIHLPDTITNVGERSFDQIHALEYINIPKSLTTVNGRQPFGYGGWNNLEWSGKWAPMTLEVPGTLRTWNSSAFSGNHYTSAVLGEGIEMVGEYAFSGNKDLASFTLPGTLKYIKQYAFSSLDSLKAIELPEGLEYIGNNAFQGDPLESVTLPDSLKYIGTQAFDAYVTDYSVTPSVTTYLGVKDLTIPGGVVGMGWNAICPEVNVTVTLGSQKNMVVERNDLTNLPTVVWDGRTDIPEGDYSVVPEGVTVSPNASVKVEGTLYVNGTVQLPSSDFLNDATVVMGENGSVEQHTHTPVTRGSSAATCTSDGYTGDTYCSACGALLGSGSTIPALGHTWGEWAVVREPANGVPGAEERSCTRCGTIETRSYGLSLPVVTDPGLEAVENFEDVHADDWFVNAVARVAASGLMFGKSDKIFAPSSNMTRAELATVIFRMAGSPEFTSVSDFKDVPESAYYSQPVAWAESVGIIYGYGNGCFGPGNEISREALAVILWRYAKLAGFDVTVNAPALTGFEDASKVSNWAWEAMSWAVDRGIIRGRDSTRLSPDGEATRAEVATMLVRFMDLGKPAAGTAPEVK